VSSKAKAEAVVYGLDKLGELLGGTKAVPYVGGALAAGALAPQEAEAGPIKVLSHIDEAGKAVYKTVIDAWHGSPHKFPPTERNPLGEFDISKIGTGEGAQAYGHGLYLADAKDVGNQYRINLGYNPDEMKIAGTQINDYYTTLSDQAAALPVEQARPLYDRMELVERLMQNESVSDVAKYADELGQGEWFGKEVAPSYETFGGLYRAQIDVDPDTLLDWDKPLSEQSEAVQQRVKQAAINRGLPLDDAGNPLFLQGNPDGQAINATLSGMKGQEGGSSVLRDAGIPGIRYLDGVSRNAGEGSYNYVMFDDKPINIVERGNANPLLLGGAALATGGAMALGAQEAEASFIGQAAKTWPAVMEAFARKMKHEGVSRNEIWQKTGIDLDNVDGLPRMEIPDNPSLVTANKRHDGPLAGYYQNDEAYRAYPDIEQKTQLTLDPDGSGASYVPGLDRIVVRGANETGPYPASAATHEVQHAIQEREGFALGGNLDTAQKYYWDSLKNKYVDKKGWELTQKADDLSGQMRPLRDARNILEMRSISQPRQLFNSSFWYEYSDQIRSAIGSPPKSGSQKDYARRAGHWIADKLSNDADYATRQVMSEFGNDKEAIKRRIKNLDAQYLRVVDNGLPDVTKLRREMDRVDPYNATLSTEEEYRLYTKLAGEAEARNVQFRLKMTDAERRATPPWETVDVPESEQIVRMRGNATPLTLAATAAGTGAGMTATSSQQDGGNYFRDNFNTQLSPQEEQAYQGWLVKQGMQLGRDLRHEADDYDMRGLFKDTGGANIDPGHGTDRYKKPNHPTFSDESVYSGVSDVVKGGRFLGGQWGGDDQSGYTYTPSPNMLERTHTPERLSRYMGEREKNVQLVMPPPYRQQQEQLNSSPLQIDTTGQYSDQINAYVRDAFEAQTAADQFTQMRSSKQGYWEARRQELLDMVDSLGELAVESSPTLVGAMGMIGMNKDRLMTDADMPLRSLLAGGGAIIDAAQGRNLQTIGNNAQQIIQSPSEDTTYGVGGTITDALSPYIPDEAAAAAGALVHGGLQIGTL
jgi:hypothetical protein